ncbi:MAG: M42 family metallopeptidase [Anaerorhabdus sp.]
MDLNMVQEMSEAHGISGCEKEVSRIMRKWMEPLVDAIDYDNLGSIIGVQKGEHNGPKVMIAGHLDEVGFMVREIDKQGFIKMLPVGGWWGHVLPSQTLYVTTQAGSRYHGVVGCSAPHGLSAEVKEKVIKPIDLFFDLGVESREEVIEMGIQIGDMITPDTKFEVMNNPNILMGKAWDDRLCACVAIDVLKELKNDNHVSNVYAVGTMQEEVGLRGARSAANHIHPDVAIALDVTTSMDTPMDKGTMKLGAGVVLSVMDAGIIGHKGLLHEIENICSDLNLDVNFDMMVAGGTDADNIHKAFDGIICMTLSIPTRYMHSHRLLIHRKDYVQTVQAIAEFCRRVDFPMLERLGQCIR